MASLTDCALCLEPFTEPKQLPCTHTFCLQCLEQLVRLQPQNSFPCPECRARIKVISIWSFTGLPHQNVICLFRYFLFPMYIKYEQNAVEIHMDSVGGVFTWCIGYCILLIFHRKDKKCLNRCACWWCNPLVLDVYRNEIYREGHFYSESAINHWIGRLAVTGGSVGLGTGHIEFSIFNRQWIDRYNGQK